MTDRNAVFASEFWHGANGRSLAQGFRDLGWAVEEIDEREFVLTGRSLLTRLERRLMAPLHRNTYNTAILEAAERQNALFALTIKGVSVTGSTLAALRHRGTKTVNYYPDFSFSFTGFDEALFEGYDLIATTKSFHVEHIAKRLGRERVALVHHGFSPLVHRPLHPRMLDESQFVHDVLYIGNASPYKLTWLSALAQAMPDIDFLVAGNGWTKLAKGTPLERHVLGRALVGDFYAREVGRARISIGLHMGPAGENDWQDLVSTRTFEIPACRGFMLHIDSAEVRDLFDVPSEIDVFSSPDELIAKVRYYLANFDVRQAVAEAGHTRAWRDHSMQARAREIAALIDQRAGGRSSGQAGPNEDGGAA